MIRIKKQAFAVLLRFYFRCLKATNPPPVLGLGAFPVLKGEGLGSSCFVILAWRGGSFWGHLRSFRSQTPCQPQEELPQLRCQGEGHSVPPASTATTANKWGDWAEGQEFKSLFYSRPG